VVRHVALFRWKPEASSEDISRLEEALRALPAKIPAIRSYRFGRDLGIQDGNADFGVVADFADEKALESYWNHPDHQAVLRERVRPIMAQREAIQYVIDHTD
jgi:hypothetical protein